MALSSRLLPLYIFPPAPSDYASMSTLLTFSPGRNHQCVNLDVRDDNEIEETENFRIVLTSTDKVSLILDEALINILDNDGKGSKTFLLF